MGLTNLHRKKQHVTKRHTEPRTWRDSLDKRPKRRNVDMRFGTWNIRSLYRVGSLMTIYAWIYIYGSTLGSTCLRHCTKRRKVASSIFDDVIAFFQLTQSFQPHNGHGIELASNELNTRNITWGGGGKDCRCVRLTTAPPSLRRLSRECRVLDEKHTGLYGLLQGQLYFVKTLLGIVGYT
jgi:hypothetical protein